MSDDNDDDYVLGQIKVNSIEMSRGQIISAYTAFVEIANIAAIIALESDGPTRLLFTGGGHLDICGSAEIWRRKVAIARIKQETLS